MQEEAKENEVDGAGAREVELHTLCAQRYVCT